MSRKAIPEKIERSVLIKSRRRCAFCFFFENNRKRVEGQIAHIDRDRSNHNESNLVFLCLPHHNEYDTRPSQTKRYHSEEAKSAKASLESYIKTGFPQEIGFEEVTPIETTNGTTGISAEVYRLRHPIYAALQDFLISILREADVADDARIRFVKGVEDAAFLYDEAIERYLSEVHTKALKFARVQRILKRGNPRSENEWQRAVELDYELMEWFENERTNSKHRFVKYLRLAC